MDRSRGAAATLTSSGVDAMKPTRSWLLGLVLLTMGCASASSNGNGEYRRELNRITAEEISDRQFSDAYELVSVIRPNWLRTRGPQSLSDPQAGQVLVYLDGIRAGGAQFLRNLSATRVAYLEYLPPALAASRYGTDHDGGVILVSSRRD
jgi:hypothetical protein